jgi:hypothetical protein
MSCKNGDNNCEISAEYVNLVTDSAINGKHLPDSGDTEIVLLLISAV